MRITRIAASPRCGVIDLGSNSVRLVVYEGYSRNPAILFNEKAVVRLGQGLQATRRLSQDSIAQAVAVIQRFHAIGQAMAADPFHVIATAAVREAENGPEFAEALRQVLPDVPIRILSGQEEAAYSADGVLCGVPMADGLLADIGGGSLELMHLTQGKHGSSETLPLGVIRLAERSGRDLARASGIVEDDLRSISWLRGLRTTDLYLVGGTWRAMARVHQMQTKYPLPILHLYTIGREDAGELAALIASVGKKELERLPGIQRRRADDMPYAGIILRTLLRLTNVRRVVFSTTGLREGWFIRQMPTAVREQEPLISGAVEMAVRWARDTSLPPALMIWMNPLFANETEREFKLREAACWVADIGSHEHPQFRAEQAFLNVLRQYTISVDHFARAFLALTVAIRYGADIRAPFLKPALRLLDINSASRAEVLGIALRLAFTLSAGAQELLKQNSLSVRGQRLTLTMSLDPRLGLTEEINRSLERLAVALGLATDVIQPEVVLA